MGRSIKIDSRAKKRKKPLICDGTPITLSDDDDDVVVRAAWNIPKPTVPNPVLPSSSSNKVNDAVKPKRRRLAKDDPQRIRPYMPRKPGRLSKLLDMPFDILCEVFGHLDPLDLLSLCRTTKSMRTMLLTRSTAISIWKTSLSRYRKLLRLLPDDMDEPAFAYLMLGRNCHYCLRRMTPIALNRDFRLRTKICTSCLVSECDKRNGDFMGEFQKAPEYNESIGYPKKLWDKRPSIGIPTHAVQRFTKPDKRYVRAVPAGLDARWAREYAEAKDKNEWVKAKLKELDKARTYQSDCVWWSMRRAPDMSIMILAREYT